MPSVSHSSVPLPRTNITCGAPNTGMNGQTASVSTAEHAMRMIVDVWSVAVIESSDHRADALVGEDLEQQHVGDAAVEDVGAAHAVAHRVDAALDLGDHPAGDRAVGHQRVELVGGGLADQAGRVVDARVAALRCR